MKYVGQFEMGEASQTRVEIFLKLKGAGFIGSDLVQLPRCERVDNCNDELNHLFSSHSVQVHEVFKKCVLKMATIPPIENLKNVWPCFENIDFLTDC
jgi:hypothetical protein